MIWTLTFFRLLVDFADFVNFAKFIFKSCWNNWYLVEDWNFARCQFSLDQHSSTLDLRFWRLTVLTSTNFWTFSGVKNVWNSIFRIFNAEHAYFNILINLPVDSCSHKVNFTNFTQNFAIHDHNHEVLSVLAVWVQSKKVDFSSWIKIKTAA